MRGLRHSRRPAFLWMYRRGRTKLLDMKATAEKTEAVVKEVTAILAKEGVVPPNGGEGEAAWLELVWQVVENTANNKASMLQDVEAKRLTERGAILGPLIERAERHGLRCELLKGLDRKLAQVEAGF